MKFPSLRMIAQHPRLQSLARRFLISGKASPEATLSFMRRSGLPAFLQLEKSKLYISPVIHGSLRNWASRRNEEDYESYISYCAEKAAINRSNAIVVYEHGRDGEYSLSQLNELFSDSECDISRSEAITIANLGSPASADELAQRLQRACQLTNLESIDLAYLEIDDNTVSNNRKLLYKALDELNNMCLAGKLLAFGYKSSLLPYTRHKPILSDEDTQGPNVMANVLLEMNGRLWQHFELALYPISLTSSIPSTFPMLEDLQQGDESGSGESAEEGRVTAKIDLRDRGILSALSLGPSISSGIGSGPFSSKEEEDGEDEESKKLDEMLRILEQADEADSSLTEEQRKALRETTSAPSQFTRVACDPLLCYINPEGISIDMEPLMDAEEAQAQLYAARQRAREPWVMMDASLPPNVCEDLRKEMDKHCPQLADTPKVEDKAMRAVLSLGCDLVMMDAECSATMDRFNIRAEQMLSHRHTAEIFDHFTYYGI